MSSSKFLEAFSFLENKEIIARLIKRDMEIHLLKAADIPNFIENKKDAITLLVVGLAEIYSNCKMFGGEDSTSFKIKFKRINQRGKTICKEIFE